jgi:hypothetical protein
MEWTDFVTCCDACQKRKKRLNKVAKKSDDAMCLVILIIPDTDSDLMPDACSEGWRTPWSERSDAGF